MSAKKLKQTQTLSINKDLSLSGAVRWRRTASVPRSETRATTAGEMASEPRLETRTTTTKGGQRSGRDGAEVEVGDDNDKGEGTASG